MTLLGKRRMAGNNNLELINGNDCSKSKKFVWYFGILYILLLVHIEIQGRAWLLGSTVEGQDLGQAGKVDLYSQSVHRQGFSVLKSIRAGSRFSFFIISLGLKLVYLCSYWESETIILWCPAGPNTCRALYTCNVQCRFSRTAPESVYCFVFLSV